MQDGLFGRELVAAVLREPRADFRFLETAPIIRPECGDDLLRRSAVRISGIGRAVRRVRAPSAHAVMVVRRRPRVRRREG
jgi:hypothetical protein